MSAQIAAVAGLSEQERHSRFVAEQVRLTLFNRRISQASAGRQLGLTPSQISTRCRGVVPFEVGELSVLADWLRIDVGAFFPAQHDAVGPAGLEPATYGLKVRSSAN